MFNERADVFRSFLKPKIKQNHKTIIVETKLSSDVGNNSQKYLLRHHSFLTCVFPWLKIYIAIFNNPRLFEFSTNLCFPHYSSNAYCGYTQRTCLFPLEKLSNLP